MDEGLVADHAADLADALSHGLADIVILVAGQSSQLREHPLEDLVVFQMFAEFGDLEECDRLDLAFGVG